MRKKTKNSSILFYLAAFVFMLMEARCWIGFGFRFILPFLILVGLTMLGLLGGIKFEFKRRYIIFSVLYLFSLYFTGHVWEQNINGLIYVVISAVNVLFFLSIPDDTKDNMFSSWIKWFGYLMIPSLIIFFITIFTSLPSIGIVYADYGQGAITELPFQNYFFYLLPIGENFSSGSHRFNGPFIEPGDLGCICAFLLFAARYDFKRYKGLKYIAVALLATLSLAGWLMTAIGYLLHMFDQNRLKGRSLFAIVILILGVYIFGTFYNQGDNVINNAILSRLQSDDEMGFSGNNRTSLLKMGAFYEMWDNPDVLWFGYTTNDIEALNEKGKGAGFISQMVSSGLIGVVSMLLAFLLFSLKSSTRRFACFFFAIFILYFLQRTDLWVIYIVSYVYGIVINEQNKRLFQQ